jgi:AbrB family looped-hinge helix DNA binding protein
MIDMKTHTVTVSSKYQVVIPRDVRESAKIKPGSKMMVVNYGGIVRLLPVLPPRAYRGIARGMDTTIVDDPERF